MESAELIQIFLVKLILPCIIKKAIFCQKYYILLIIRYIQRILFNIINFNYLSVAHLSGYFEVRNFWSVITQISRIKISVISVISVIGGQIFCKIKSSFLPIAQHFRQFLVFE